VAGRSTVEFCRGDDLPELFAKFATWYAFNPRMREPDYFAWQFRDCPVRLGAGEYDFLVLRNAAGAVSGCLGFAGFEFLSDGLLRTGGWTHNWYVAGQPDGGLALLFRFMELVDHRFLIRLSGDSAAVTNLLRIPLLPAISRWWAVVDARRAIDLFKVEDTGDRAILQASATALSASLRAPAFAFVDRFDKHCEFAFADWPTVSAYARRTASYLNWRYIDIPQHKYRVIRSEQAFAVYRIEQVMGTDASVLRLLEWNFGPAEAAAALSTILDDAVGAHLVFMDFHCTALAIGAALEPFGFVAQSATRAPLPDLFRPLNHSGGYPVAIDLPPHRSARSIDFSKWYITLGDSDIDRVKL
jgi:hypothetical protein